MVTKNNALVCAMVEAIREGSDHLRFVDFELQNRLRAIEYYREGKEKLCFLSGKQDSQIMQLVELGVVYIDSSHACLNRSIYSALKQREKVVVSSRDDLVVLSHGEMLCLL